jgi:3-deoxy-manno-octulosonate cytidylyltransferase (CMP-KDO synthetase)
VPKYTTNTVLSNFLSLRINFLNKANLNTLGIIPARYASTRFPGKPLVDIHGKSMIQRVYEQAKKAKTLNDVVVATDDERIEQHVKAFGGNVVMTESGHPSGTDRCYEACVKFWPQAEIVINIQGDEPFIAPEQIDLLVSCFKKEETQIATLMKKINSIDELFNENTPKVIVDASKKALYFSRQTIPFIRGKAKELWLNEHVFYKHIGIYGYQTSVLKELVTLKISDLEKAEALEQLRWLENGYFIQTELTDFESVAIDTPEDLKKTDSFL